MFSYVGTVSHEVPAAMSAGRSAAYENQAFNKRPFPSVTKAPGGHTLCEVNLRSAKVGNHPKVAA